MVRMRNSLECRLGSKRFNLFSNESCEIYYVVTVSQRPVRPLQKTFYIKFRLPMILT